VRKRIHCEDEKAVSEACAVLKNGGVIVYPTDSLYGFGCDAKNEFAIQKINSIKGRIAPMSVLAPNKETASNWMNIPEHDKKYVLKKLGSKTTLITPVLDEVVSNSITGDKQTLGMRIPDHKFCQKLSQEYPNPITTTSVNRTGEEPMTNPEEIISEFGNEIDLIIEDGIIAGSGSTIYFFKEGDLKILRS
jgi:L-threonylcarbamoyladenylate synthase